MGAASGVTSARTTYSERKRRRFRNRDWNCLTSASCSPEADRAVQIFNRLASKNTDRLPQRRHHFALLGAGVGGAAGSGESGVRRKVRQNSGTGGAETKNGYRFLDNRLMLASDLARPEGWIRKRLGVCSPLRGALRASRFALRICRTLGGSTRPPHGQDIKKPAGCRLFYVWRARKDSNLRPPSS